MEAISAIVIAMMSEPDITIPDIFYRVKAEVSPERRLIIAMIEDVLTARHRSEITDAIEWVTSDESNYIFSFVRCCEELGLAIQSVRKRLVAMLEERLAKLPPLPIRIIRPQVYTYRARKRERLIIPDVPGRTYSHAYATCPKLSVCHECLSRYNTWYQRGRRERNE